MGDSSYSSIISRLKNVRRRYISVGIVEALVCALGLLVLFFTLFSFLESFLYLNPNSKEWLFFSSFIIPAFIFLVLSLYRMFHYPTIDECARLVERSYPSLNDRLISAVQLGRLNPHEIGGQSHGLINALIHRVDEESRLLPLTKVVSKRRLVIMVRVVVGVIVLVLISSLIFSQSMIEGAYRLVDYSRSYMRPNNCFIFTLKRDSIIIRGEDFTTPGFLMGGDPEHLSVYCRWDDSDVWTVKPVAVDPKNGDFTLTIEKPHHAFTYYITSGSFETPRHRVIVIERPDIEKISLTLTYPHYTGLSPAVMNESDGNIRAIKGTRVTLHVQVNKPLSSMVIHWSDSSNTKCAVHGSEGSAAFSVVKNNDYHFDLLDTLGISNSNPINYRVTSLSDEIPRVTILSPAVDCDIPYSMSFPIVYRAGDDYGLTRVMLTFNLPQEESPRQVELKMGSLGKLLEDSYTWDMSPLGLLPDDKVTFFLTVVDADTVDGPKVGMSETRTVTLPSMTELFKEVLDESSDNIDKLRDVAKQTTQEQITHDQVMRNIINGNESDWNDKKSLENAQENIEKMQKTMSDVSDALSEMGEKLSDSDMASLETLNKYQQISELLDSITEGPMKEALKHLFTIQNTLDPQKKKEALDKYKITVDDVKKKLDSIIKLLEQVKTIQRFEMAQKALEKLAQRQAELATQFRKNPKDTTHARTQSSIASEMKSLEEALQDITDDLKNTLNVRSDSLRSFLETHDISHAMEETSTTMSSKAMKKTEQNLGDVSTMLSGLLKEVNALASAMRSETSAEVKRRLFAAMGELLAVSELQEKFLNEVREKLPSKSSAAYQDSPITREVEVVDALEKTQGSLSSLSEIFINVSGMIDAMVSHTKLNMVNSVDAFSIGDDTLGEQKAYNALASLNNTIHILSKLLTKNSGDGSGMAGDILEQLEAIANGQLSLEMLMGNASSEELMMRLSAEQEKLARMLTELQKKITNDKRLNEMLDKLTGDMDDAAQMMKHNEKREYIERKQQDIYRRLLDARRSHREKEETTERKSWTAKKNISKGAERLASDYGEKRRELQFRMKKALEGNFEPAYLNVIQQYFDSILRDVSNTTK